MTVKPCSNCGGTGDCPMNGTVIRDTQEDIWWCDEGCSNCGGTGQCPRCKGMPKLDVREFQRRGASNRAINRQFWGFPDPDTVMWWCFTHGYSMWTDDECIERFSTLDDGLFQPIGDCKPGWVPRPDKPLEVAE